MALLKGKSTELPEGAVMLTETDALQHQMNLVKEWRKGSEVFALRYGPYIIGAATLVSGVFFNNHFRRKFFLQHYGQLASYLPVCLVPSALSFIFHSELVLRNVVLMKANDCPVCLQVRAAALQATFSVGLPLLIAPVGCASIAIRYSTYDVPYLHSEPLNVLKMVQKMTKKIQTKILYIALGQAFLASVLTYCEVSNLSNIHKRLTEIDNQISNN